MLSEISKSQKDKYHMFWLIKDRIHEKHERNRYIGNQVHTYFHTDEWYSGDKHTMNWR